MDRELRSRVDPVHDASAWNRRRNFDRFRSDFRFFRDRRVRKPVHVHPHGVHLAIDRANTWKDGCDATYGVCLCELNNLTGDRQFFSGFLPYVGHAVRA